MTLLYQYGGHLLTLAAGFMLIPILSRSPVAMLVLSGGFLGFGLSVAVRFARRRN